MKKLLVAVFVIIVLPALVLFYFAMNSKSEKRSTYKNYNDVSVSSEEDSPEYILGEPQKQLYSPLQKLCVNIDTDENGTLFYTVSDSSGLLLLDRSYIGIKTDQCDFSQGLSFVRQTPAQIHDEKYTNISGKRNISRNYYSETVLTYERDNFFYDVYLRAYEDGFAYRSGIRSKDSSQIQLSVEEETGNFSVPPKSSITAELVNNIEQRVFPVGRLDRDSEGLLLMTNDGDFANRISHPRSHVSKTYRVTVRQQVTEEMLARLAEGLMIDGQMTLPADVNLITKEENRNVMQITLYEGRNRQIRKMCEELGLEVIRLKRTAVGNVKLGMLRPGDWRDLSDDELRSLMASAQISAARQKKAAKASENAPYKRKKQGR